MEELWVGATSGLCYMEKPGILNHATNKMAEIFNMRLLILNSKQKKQLQQKKNDSLKFLQFIFQMETMVPATILAAIQAAAIQAAAPIFLEDLHLLVVAAIPTIFSSSKVIATRTVHCVLVVVPLLVLVVVVPPQRIKFLHMENFKRLGVK